MNSVNKTNFAKTVKAASQNNRRAARLIIEAYERGTCIVRPNYTDGRGRHSFINYNEDAVKRILDTIGLSYNTTNDAPKGGATGVLIAFTIQ